MPGNIVNGALEATWAPDTRLAITATCLTSTHNLQLFLALQERFFVLGDATSIHFLSEELKRLDHCLELGVKGTSLVGHVCVGTPASASEA